MKDLKELAQLWSDFRSEWDNEPKHQKELDGVKGILKPHFSDFMDWITDNF